MWRIESVASGLAALAKMNNKAAASGEKQPESRQRGGGGGENGWREMA